MLKATFNLPNGTLVTIEGAQEDIKELLDYYSSSYSTESSNPTKKKTGAKPSKKENKTNTTSEVPSDTLTQIVNLIKSCPEAEAIENNIFNKKKTNEANRTLLPLYIVREYLNNAFGLTTVEIEKITTELGPKIKVRRQNALRALARSSSSKYVLGDKRRKIGTATRYTLNDRGFEYIKSILANKQSEK